MIRRIITLVLLIVNSGTPARAAYLYWQDGSVTYVPDEVIMPGALILCAIACLWLLSLITQEASSSPANVDLMDFDLPEEMRAPESVEYYDDLTERTLALKRKLDVDTELTESRIKAARAKAELDDLEHMFGGDEASRRANGHR